jgi:aspartate carbamoyltransferase catalytic subunit
MSTAWKRKDLLTIRELERSEIELILDHARTFKDLLARRVKKSSSLEGRTVVNLFVEPSTRTRTSFELAATRLDADVVSIDSASSSFRKGETLKDTGQVLEAMKADFVVLRHSAAGAPQFLAERLKSHVINAGDGAHEHPTQALLDAFTMRERLGDKHDWATLHVVICGDILFSRVARSNVWALRKLGARVTLVGPTTLVPDIFCELGVTVTHDFDAVLPEADVIMLLRIQHERQQRSFFPSVGEYVSLFGLNMTRFQKCKPDVLIMHPGPVNRGVEIASELADGLNSTILDQVQNGLAVRMAVLHLLGGGATPYSSDS